MKFDQIHTVYFIGIGGIGMSALARYFNAQQKIVIGYDKTQTELTIQLEKEGIKIHYEDLGDQIVNQLDKKNTLVIYTPAIPKEHKELNTFIQHEFTLIKRAKALGIISDELETFAVAGTHGKTTTTCLLSHVLYQTKEKCNAFIGGIAANYNSNCIIEPHSKKIVVEADEFDRSFLQLNPKYAIITSMDADHLDIYGTNNELEKSFNDFIKRIDSSGFLLLNAGINAVNLNDIKIHVNTYGINKQADWSGENLHYENEKFIFDIVTKEKHFKSIELGIPGDHNAENAIAVFALCYQLGIDETSIRNAFISFKGVQRRFDFQIKNDDLVIIDDYAHHPTEINAFLNAVRNLYPTKKITAVFQPHLFSRTRDFMDEFAKALSNCDELYLLPIYPARELPIPQITSENLLDKISMSEKFMSSKANIVTDLKSKKRDVILIMGAGDIDTCVKPIKEAFETV